MNKHQVYRCIATIILAFRRPSTFFAIFLRKRYSLIELRFCWLFRKLQALVGYPSVLQVTNRSTLSVEAQSSSTFHLNCRNPYPTALNITETFCSPVNAQASTTSSIHQGFFPPSADGDEASPPKSISSLSQALDHDSSQIKDFLSRSKFDAAGDDLKRMVEEPHVDLQLDKGRLSPKAKSRAD